MARKDPTVKVIYQSPSHTHLATVNLTAAGMPLRQVLQEAAKDIGFEHLEQHPVLVNNRNYGLDTTVSAGDTISVVAST
jgi:hypothetical protein